MSGATDARRVGRVQLQVLSIALCGAALCGGVVSVLSDRTEGARETLAGAPHPDAPLVAPPGEAAAASASQLAPEAPEPPGRRLESERSYPPLATSWREAVLLSKRQQVLAGANALRRASDGKEQLLALMEDESPRVRAFALRELGRRKDPTLAPVLTRFLSDPSPYVAENARWGLEHLEGSK